MEFPEGKQEDKMPIKAILFLLFNVFALSYFLTTLILVTGG